MNLTNEFRQKVVNALLEQRENYGGSDSDYAKSKGIKPAIFSRLKNGGN
ncbi:hypothetical protein JJC03_15655 [Flavobacterium oreochromis]|nr:hypothetical protein [Flavobacterium oreochromis]QYS86335.1 hypothetical protein JJC03_15655 [Flavobacterium oreochromis]